MVIRMMVYKYVSHITRHAESSDWIDPGLPEAGMAGTVSAHLISSSYGLGCFRCEISNIYPTYVLDGSTSETMCLQHPRYP